jgi:hypothetical protein
MTPYMIGHTPTQSFFTETSHMQSDEEMNHAVKPEPIQMISQNENPRSIDVDMESAEPEVFQIDTMTKPLEVEEC